MNSRLIYAIFDLAIAVFCYKNWREYRDKDFLWFLGLSGTALVVDLIYYFLIILNVSPDILSTTNSIISALYLIALTIVAGFVVKGLMKRRKR